MVSYQHGVSPFGTAYHLPPAGGGTITRGRSPANPHTEGVSNGEAAPLFLYDSRETRFFRHLERRYVSVWETDGKRFDDTLSREISHLNVSWAIAE